MKSEINSFRFLFLLSMNEAMISGFQELFFRRFSGRIIGEKP
jgi:hypothetical protein